MTPRIDTIEKLKQILDERINEWLNKKKCNGDCKKLQVKYVEDENGNVIGREY